MEQDRQTRRQAAQTPIAGLIALQLISQWASWVKRRSEVIDLADRATVRRITTITVAPHLVEIRPDVEGAEWLPITTVWKDWRGSIIVRDEAGDRVPTLNSSESGRLGAETLNALASALTDGRASDDPSLPSANQLLRHSATW